VDVEVRLVSEAAMVVDLEVGTEVDMEASEKYSYSSNNRLFIKMLYFAKSSNDIKYKTIQNSNFAKNSNT
jgi:hypothetical protein